MREPFSELRHQYKNTTIPEDYSSVVEKALTKSTQRKWYNRPFIKIASIAAVLFITLLNVSPTFASKVSSIPILGNVADIFHIIRIQENDANSTTDVTLPNVSGLTDEAFEKMINSIIQEKVEQKVVLAQKNAEQFISGSSFESDETNGIKVEIFGDFDKHFVSPTLVSFSVFIFESAASSYISRDFYTIDVQTNTQLFLPDMFKENENYVDILSNEIKNQITQRKKDPQNMYFEDEGFPGVFDKIDPNQAFYLDKKGNIVIYFEKYSIAPGYMGEQTFTIPNDLIKAIRK
ncbi:MAG: RsiV family protein [Bacilli bacterium]